MEPSFLDLLGAEWTAPDRYEVRPDARRFESWEAGLAARAGLREAVPYARGWGLDAVAERVTAAAAGLRERLAEVPGVTVHDRGRRRCGIVSFAADGTDAEAVRAHLAAEGINVSVSDPSSTLLDARARGLPPLVRASVHYLTTDDELDTAVRAVAAATRVPR